MTRDFVRFLHAVFSKWLSGMTGIFGLIFTITGLFLNGPALTTVFVLLGVCCLLFAAFFAWRERDIAAFGQTARAEQLKTIDQWIGSGNWLADRIHDYPAESSLGRAALPPDDLKKTVGAWVESIRENVRREFPDFHNHFMNDAGLAMGNSLRVNKHGDFSRLLHVIEMRLSRLGELRQEVASRPDRN
jgi:hypothetical protein